MAPADHWALDESFRLLSYGFRVRTRSRDCSEAIDRALGSLRAHQSAGEPTFTLTEHPGSVASIDLVLDERAVLRKTMPAKAFTHLLWLIMREAVTSSDNFLLLHAGAVARDGRAVLMPGKSGRGKTTLTGGLVRAGFAYLSDEIAPLDPASRHILPAPRPLCFKEVPRGLVVGLPRLSAGVERFFAEVWPVRADLIRPGATGAPASLGVVVVPVYESGAPTRVEPITRAEALVELASNTFNLQSFEGNPIELLADVLRGADCYRLASGDLDAAVTAIEGLMPRAG